MAEPRHGPKEVQRILAEVHGVSERQRRWPRRVRIVSVEAVAEPWLLPRLRCVVRLHRRDRGAAPSDEPRGPLSPFVGGGLWAARVASGETRMTFPKTRTVVPGTSRTGLTWIWLLHGLRSL